jgi:hypothetical protein
MEGETQEITLKDTHLRQGAVVPEVALVGEEVLDEARVVVEGVLVNWVEALVSGYLRQCRFSGHVLILGR